MSTTPEATTSRELVLPSRLDTIDQVDEALESWSPEQRSEQVRLKAGELRRLSRSGARALMARLSARGVRDVLLTRALPEVSAQLAVAAAVEGLRLSSPPMDLTPRSKRPSPRRRR